MSKRFVMHRPPRTIIPDSHHVSYGEVPKCYGLGGIESYGDFYSLEKAILKLKKTLYLYICKPVIVSDLLQILWLFQENVYIVLLNK